MNVFLSRRDELRRSHPVYGTIILIVFVPYDVSWHRHVVVFCLPNRSADPPTGVYALDLFRARTLLGQRLVQTEILGILGQRCIQAGGSFETKLAQRSELF